MNTLYVISGATGMTGNELSRRLSKDGNLVIGFDNFFCSSLKTVEDLGNRPEFIFHQWDINHRQQMEMLKHEVISHKEKYHRLVYINCAAVVHTKYFYHVNDTFETNVLGMRAFLSQAIEVGADIYINCSTSEVYSMQSCKEGGMKESDFLTMAHAEHSQRTSYATGKLLTEFFMKEAVDEKKIKGCSIRFANVYSKNELFSDHIIPHIIYELRTKGKVELLENSKINRRTFLHNEDSCGAVIALIESEHALDGTVYNVATDEEISIIDLVSLCGKALGIEKPEIVFKGYRKSDPERRILNTDKIRQLTGWKPAISLEEGIYMCVEDKKDEGIAFNSSGLIQQVQ